MIKARVDKKAKLIDYFSEHWYDIFDDNGNKIDTLPSVTSIIGKSISKGFAFEQWLRDTGNESKVIAREAADSGSKLHNAIEMILQGNKIEATEFKKEEWEKLFNFVNWHKHYKIRTIHTEITIYDVELGYAGTVDYICEIDGELWLLDWKTGKGIYETSNVQVAAYVKAWNKLNPSQQIKKAAIVHVGANIKTTRDMNSIGIKFIPVEIEQDFEIFEAALKIYKRFYPKDVAPSNIFPLELSINGEDENEEN